MYDIIEKKKNGGALTPAEIAFAVDGFVAGSVPDYQMSALLMAICLKGMGMEETTALTLCMARSGDTVDLSPIPGVKADKHSTGGVGDKTTLAVAPIVAACGVKMAKMSGRGLGHTGGTIDKLESIPGFRVDLDRERFFQIVRKCGLCVVGQSGNLVPADKKMYALRDVTATVDSIPLIASSIMSKKLAAGADCILLDVKTGSGAFMKTEADAVRLAETMVRIGVQAGKKCAAFVTDMDRPLGSAIGNALEVQEAADMLRGRAPEDFTSLCLTLSAGILTLAVEDGGPQDESALFRDSMERARRAVRSGEAFVKLSEMVAEQGGDPDALSDYSLFGSASVTQVVRSAQGGVITSMDTEKIGKASALLGAGRETKESVIDYLAGIRLLKKTGDAVEKGEPIALLYASDARRIAESEVCFVSALRIGKEPRPVRPLVLAKVTACGCSTKVEQFH
jgi:pyrimidine-nucleoside phosphorylase